MLRGCSRTLKTPNSPPLGRVVISTVRVVMMTPSLVHGGVA